MMRRSSWWSCGALLGLAWAVLAASPAWSQEQVSFRDLVRRFHDNKDGKPLASLVGLAQPAKHLVALDYKLLLVEGGSERSVDPDKHKFKLGDQIRISVTPLSDVYVYIFHQGASGQRVCLLPVEQEQVPRVKANQTILLPTDGYFEFAPPAGKEELLVVATERPIADLALLSNVVFKKEGEKLSAEEKAVKETLAATANKTLNSIRAQQRARDKLSFRGLPSSAERAEFAQQQSARRASEAVITEPPRTSGEGTLTMVASSDDKPASLLVSIPLESMENK